MNSRTLSPTGRYPTGPEIQDLRHVNIRGTTTGRFSSAMEHRSNTPKAASMDFSSLERRVLTYLESEASQGQPLSGVHKD